MGHKARGASNGAKKNETTTVGALLGHSPEHREESESGPFQELLDKADRRRKKRLAASLPPVRDDELTSLLVQAIIGRWTDAEPVRQALHQEVLMFIAETASDIAAVGSGERFRLVHESAWFCMAGEDPFFESRANGPTEHDLIVEAPRTAEIPAGRWCILRGH